MASGWFEYVYALTPLKTSLYSTSLSDLLGNYFNLLAFEILQTRD